MYSFRLRFRISDGVKLAFEEVIHTLIKIDSTQICLQGYGGESIKESKQLVTVGCGYKTPEDAYAAGVLTQDRLILAFAKLRFPADFGTRAAKGSLTIEGQKWLKKGTPRVRSLNDVHGLQVYETDPQPKFLAVAAEMRIILSKERTIAVLKEAFAIELNLNEKRRLAFELFSASSFVGYVDARFMLLMMAVETLIVPDLRAPKEVQLLDDLINMVTKSTVENKETIGNAIRGLRRESIRAAGRRLAANLGDLYDDQLSTEFFNQCYKIRNQLVHGHTPRPTFEDVNRINAQLERFAADMISYPEFQG